MRHRVFFVFVSVVFAGLVLHMTWPRVAHQSDFDLQVQAAKALLGGENPYLTVGPDRDRFFPFPYYYPLPAALFALPFVWLPLNVIRVAYVLLGTGLLAWFASKEGWLRAPLIFNGALINSMMIGQWSPYLTLALIAPAFAGLMVVKPNFGLAFSGASFTKRYAISFFGVGALLGVIALLFVPSWPLDWLNVIRNTPPGSHSAPIMATGGFLILLALFRWRTFEARLLVGMALVPQTGLLYDTLPLFLVAKTKLQGWILAGLSTVGLVLQHVMAGIILNSQTMTRAQFIPQFNIYRAEVGTYLILLMYVPAIAIVLWNGMGKTKPETISALY